MQKVNILYPSIADSGSMSADTKSVTLDYASDSIEELIAEVVADCPTWPVVFVPNKKPDSRMLGHFCHTSADPQDLEACEAVMVERSLFDEEF